jgi:hypothetical protein
MSSQQKTAFDQKLDRVLAYLQGVKDVPTVRAAMNIFQILPSEGLDANDRRCLVRAFTTYLCDDKIIHEDPDFERKIDRMDDLLREYYTKSAQTIGRKVPKIFTRGEVEVEGVEQRDVRRRTENRKGNQIDCNEEILGAVAADSQHRRTEDLLGGDFPGEAEFFAQQHLSPDIRTRSTPIPPTRPPRDNIPVNPDGNFGNRNDERILNGQNENNRRNDRRTENQPPPPPPNVEAELQTDHDLRGNERERRPNVLTPPPVHPFVRDRQNSQHPNNQQNFEARFEPNNAYVGQRENIGDGMPPWAQLGYYTVCIRKKETQH